LCWQFLSLFLVMLGCWHLSRILFNDARAQWSGIASVMAVLTIPVAGTALDIMDQYLSPRSLSTPAVLFMVINTLNRKPVRVCVWAVVTAMVHPLMVIFGISYVIPLWLYRSYGDNRISRTTAFLLIPLSLFPSVSNAYREVLDAHSYFFFLQWHWYEWLGAFAPLTLLWCFHHIAQRQQLKMLGLVCRSLIVFGLVFFLAALLVSIPSLMSFARLQPMRCLQLIYILFFLIAGGLLGQFWLKNHVAKWILLFLPICTGMFFAQRQLFPATAHIEWPGKASANEWVKAFSWARDHTPLEAFFALNPQYMNLPGEDQHGFRAVAERSRLADRVKDSGAVSMFPALAGTWSVQVKALDGWKTFRREDFLRLRNQFGVSWVVLEQPGLAGFPCPYSNSAVLVCEIR